MMKTLFLAFVLLAATTSFANNPGVSYQGRIFKPDGAPLEGTAVQFRLQVRSPGSENCLLYEEVQTLNMAGSAGVFALTMNDGTGTRLDAPTYQVDRIFANRDTMTLDSTRCAAGTTYAPNSADGRKLVVYFKDETMSAFEAMPIMNLNYVPQAMYALEAKNVGTFAVNNILRAVDVGGNPATAPALNPTQLSNLNNLIAGTSTQYATTAQFSAVQSFAKSVPPTCGIGEVLKSDGTTLSCVTDVASGAPAYSAITGATGTNTIDNTNFSQVWNWSTATTQSPMTMTANSLTTGSAMNISTSSASLNSTNGLVNVANTGASTNGILARFQSNSTAGSGLTVLANGNVGIGTASPGVKLDIADGSLRADTSVNFNLSPATLIGKVNTTTVDSPPLLSLTNYESTVNSIAGIDFRHRNSAGAATDSAAIQSSLSTLTDAAENGFLRFVTMNAGSMTEQMRITSTGNVGVGTATPVAKFEVIGSSVASGSAPVALSVVGGNTNSGAAGTGGSVTLAAGGRTGTSAGGVLNLAGGNQSGGGGNASLTGGAGGNGWGGGSVVLSGGTTVSGSNPGSVSIGGGVHGASTNGTDISILAGAKSGTGTDGNILLATTRGNVGIGTTTPGQQLSVAGTIESTSGGFKFPDGTTQTTAASLAVGFHASGASQSIAVSTSTTLINGTQNWDRGGDNYNSTTGIFTAPIAGVYSCNCQVNFETISSARIAIGFNGTGITGQTNLGSRNLCDSAPCGFSTSQHIQANAIGSTIRCVVYQEASSAFSTSADHRNYFSCHFLGP